MTTTTETLRTETIERTATIRLVRTIDLDALFKARGENEMIAIVDIQTAGEFVVEVQPVTRGAALDRIPVFSEKEGQALIDGFLLCAELKSSKRKAKPAKAKAAPKTKPAKAKAETKKEADARKAAAAN